MRIFLLLLISLNIFPSTHFFVLGSGTPNPNPERMGSAYLVLANDTPYLFDFGSGVVRRVAALSSEWGGNFSKLDVTQLEYAFLSHIHSDHTLGLADLIITPWIMGRDKPLKIFGPEAAKDMADHIIKAYQPDIDYRIYGTQPQNDKGYKAIFTSIEEGVIYEDKNIMVTAFLNDHGDLAESYGFLIQTGDKTILISGDTGPSANLLRFGNEVDILVHEVYSQAGFEKKEPDWKIYHKAHHTSPSELAKIAKKLNPKTLVLSHILFWGSSESEILEEIMKDYDGKVILADDLIEIN
ncbi:MBL fold metallo-hydrolase [Bacteroidota bacterium]|jgi:ribonuclease BN (tRNA processing enzyme)|nr:MBL fold metallo-hydrolase [Bacteroidota bacterium]MEC7513487.1 MBL fold metallo-hydrolase [Pseudomonadota bacterium]MEC8097394.1 MBL fold metallo-hydrolase [Pseudomonadota bacterium]|tara:strand:- start:411 stop:1298 length:888 start_codon:yes stop_codon:yes gene_type:complete